jgi:uncharacterized protein YqgC (DUF456 family)
MDVFWLILGILLLLAGLVGCLLPLLPGPPLTYAGLLVLQLREVSPFSTKFLLIWAAIVVVVTVLDYVIPIYGTKKFGGSNAGVWGCTIGLVAGFWLGPLGIIIGPFVGAYIGEWMSMGNPDKALRAAIGSFLGFLTGTLLKLIVCGILTYYFIVSLW